MPLKVNSLRFSLFFNQRYGSFKVVLTGAGASDNGCLAGYREARSHERLKIFCFIFILAGAA
jgi:hypothetical protein